MKSQRIISGKSSDHQEDRSSDNRRADHLISAKLKMVSERSVKLDGLLFLVDIKRNSTVDFKYTLVNQIIGLCHPSVHSDVAF